MNSTGIWMIAVLGALIVTTGLPVWALLVGAASLFAGLGVAVGVIDWHVLMALSPRIVGLLEHDLLQALPLYVLVGVLIQRLAIADTVFSSLAAWGGGSSPATACAALGVGALIAPMNGSVASSSALLARLVAPRLAALEPARATVLVSVAATIGVVVPPSLVLILLGDAMMRAHTEAGKLPGAIARVARIVNTQDVLHAALVPAALVLASWLLIAGWQSRAARSGVPNFRPSARSHLLSLFAIGAIVALLGSVFVGRLLAVEAAASAGCVLLLLAAQRLPRACWHQVLMDTLSLSGALMALLVGATTFSLVFRAFETDRWLSHLVLSAGLPPPVAAGLILLFVAACAWVLDAFEMIFVIIPIVAPALINRLGDAQQASVLLLLVLQVSFLIPPMGYAIVMARARSGLGQSSTSRLLRAVAPFVLAQCLVIAAVLAWPRLVHLLDRPAIAGLPVEAAPSEQEIERRLREMSDSPPADTETKP